MASTSRWGQDGRVPPSPSQMGLCWKCWWLVQTDAGLADVFSHFPCLPDYRQSIQSKLTNRSKKKKPTKKLTTVWRFPTSSHPSFCLTLDWDAESVQGNDFVTWDTLLKGYHGRVLERCPPPCTESHRFSWRTSAWIPMKCSPHHCQTVRDLLSPVHGEQGAEECKCNHVMPLFYAHVLLCE